MSSKRADKEARQTDEAERIASVQASLSSVIRKQEISAQTLLKVDKYGFREHYSSGGAAVFVLSNKLTKLYKSGKRMLIRESFRGREYAYTLDEAEALLRAFTCGRFGLLDPDECVGYDFKSDEASVRIRTRQFEELKARIEKDIAKAARIANMLGESFSVSSTGATLHLSDVKV